MSSRDTQHPTPPTHSSGSRRPSSKATAPHRARHAERLVGEPLTASRRRLLSGSAALAIGSPLVAGVLGAGPWPVAAAAAEVTARVSSKTTRTEQGNVIVLEPRRASAANTTGGTGAGSSAARPKLPLVIYHHPVGASAALMLDADRAPGQRKHIVALADAGYRVVVSDFGGSLWGNQRNHRFIDDIIEAHRRNGGARGKVALFGTSMGGGVVLSYAARRRSQVACVVAMEPAIDLGNLKAQGFGVDDAFAGGYSNARYGLRASPAVIARQAANGGTGPSYAGLPVRIWVGTRDEITPMSLARQFRDNVRAGTNPRIRVLGVRGAEHTDAMVGAVPTDEVRAWVRSHLPTT